MKVVTVKSVNVLKEELQMDVHYAFGMEHYTDYVFKPREGQKYSATIVMEDTSPVIQAVIEKSSAFPGEEFIVDNLDMEGNNVDRIRVKDGKVVKSLNRGWDWEEIW